MPNPRTRQKTKAQEIRERLGTYFIGVAIGCMLVVVLLMMRRAMLGPSTQPTTPSAPTQSLP
jgi:hypothetical protein